MHLFGVNISNIEVQNEEEKLICKTQQRIVGLTYRVIHFPLYADYYTNFSFNVQ